MATIGLALVGAAALAQRYTSIERLWRDPGPPHLVPRHTDAIAFHLRGDSVLPAGRWLLFGDSLIEGLPSGALEVPAVNYGIGHDDALGVANRLPSYDSVARAEALVLGVGINELRDGRSLETIAMRFTRLLDRVPAGPRVICLAALPIDERVERRWGARSNAAIEGLNARFESLCRERGHAWVDAGPALRDPSGNLTSAYHVGDGLHLGPAGNAVFVRQLNAAFGAL